MQRPEVRGDSPGERALIREREIRDLGEMHLTDLSHTSGILVSQNIQFELPHKQSALVMMIVDRKALMMHVTEINFLLCCKNARDCGYHRPNLGLLKVPKKNTI